MTITLLDGRMIESETLAFDPETYHFTLSAEDVTDLIRRADKLAIIPYFDADIENNRIFAENWARTHGGQQPAPIGSTSTWSNFWQQITTDPLAAPLETLNRGLNQLFTAPAAVKLALLAGVGLVVWLALRRRP